MPDKVLLIEDAQDMQLMVRTTIGADCELTCASSIRDGEQKLEAGQYSLLILDVALPDGTGFELCKKLRETPRYHEVPIMFLTGEAQVDKRVQGFALGADDYVVKPFEPKEFRARVISKLKRGTGKASFALSVFHIDLTTQKAAMQTAGGAVELTLTPIEFKLLVHFLRNEGQIFSREDLLATVWGETVHVSGHTVDTHISALRKKLGSYGSSVRAVVKRGYCFTAPSGVAPS